MYDHSTRSISYRLVLISPLVFDICSGVSIKVIPCCIRIVCSCSYVCSLPIMKLNAELMMSISINKRLVHKFSLIVRRCLCRAPLPSLKWRLPRKGETFILRSRNPHIHIRHIVNNNVTLQKFYKFGLI